MDQTATPLTDSATETSVSFFDRPHVVIEQVPIGPGIPLGIERVYNPALGIGGAYGTWGRPYANPEIPAFVAEHQDTPVPQEEILTLGDLGFLSRHHVPRLSHDENIALEVRVGVRLLQEAIAACGWQPGDVAGVLLGMTAPVALDYIDRIAREAGIPDSAIKVAVHKACDGSVGSLHLSLNPTLPEAMHLPINLAQELYGKKVLIGGIEGLSRLLGPAHDIQALQLFGNGAGVIGIIPGQNMKFLAGATREAYDEEGALQVAMAYPHARERVQGRSMLEVTQIAPNQLRVAGLMHEPATTEGNREPVVMAGPMGMVKLFVRTGVITVREAYHAYLKRMAELGTPDKPIKVVIAHHANYKINLLKGKQLEKEGISLSIPWLISDFGNVSAASTMICFLRKLPELQRGDNILFDGFGAGTYYDVVAVELGA